MDVDQLRWFQQVADGVTVTEVSDLDQVSQSGISRALARLEAEIGVPLLRRSGRRLRMTAAGATLKRHVDAVLHNLDDGIAAVAELASPDTGRVTLAFQPSLGAWLVPDLIASFRRRRPQVRIELRQLRDELAGSVVDRGDADLEITTFAPTASSVRWRPMLAQPLQLAVPADHRLARRQSVGLAEASQEPFLMLGRNFVLRRATEQLCERAGFRPTPAMEAEDLPTIVGLVEAGLGVAVVPWQARRHDRGDARYLTLDDRDAVRQIGIAWSTERRLLPAATAFRAHAVEHLSN